MATEEVVCLPGEGLISDANLAGGLGRRAALGHCHLGDVSRSAVPVGSDLGETTAKSLTSERPSLRREVSDGRGKDGPAVDISHWRNGLRR